MRVAQREKTMSYSNPAELRERLAEFALAPVRIMATDDGPLGRASIGRQ